MRRRPTRGRAASAIGGLLLATLWAWGAAGAQPLGSGEIRVLGLGVDIDTRPDVDGIQASMSAVKDIPTGALAFVGQPGVGMAASVAAGSVVKAVISGPSFPDGPQTVVGLPNQLMAFPLLRVAGDHYLTNVRLEDSSGNVLLMRDLARPPIVIDVLEELLVTRVTSRQLSLEEIQERGIVIDEDNFTAFDFVVGLTLGSESVVIELPVVIPNTAQVAASLDTPQFTTPNFQAAEFAKIDIPNFSLSGFRLLPPPELEDLEIELPSIDGVVVIPGNIAFLNQFFSVVLQASNVAPEGSALVLDNARAEITLPKGDDGISESGDDPLGVAETLGGEVQAVLPLLDADGIDSIQPQATNQAEFLVEGRHTGTHVLDFEIKGDLFVPSLGESFELMGMAKGVVQVKNPSFSVVLAHPDVVRADEEYSLFTTVTNTSTTVANLFKLELRTRSLVGARLAPGQEATRTLETLQPGESATFEYRLVATVTGEVRGTVFLADESINGSFVLFTGVGDTAIPLSPDTLVLPQTVDYLPNQPDIVRAAVRMLGQAYSVATAPAGALPSDVARMSRAYVFDRAVKLAQAGLHVRFGENPVAAAQDILLDYLGNDRMRLDLLYPDDQATRERVERDLRAFDSLRRTAGAGANFSDVAGALLGTALVEDTLPEVMGDWAARSASRPAFLMAGVSSRGPPVFSRLSDGEGLHLGRLAEEEEVARQIPGAARLPLSNASLDTEEILVVAAPESGAYRFELAASQGASDVVVSLVLREENGPVQVTYAPLDFAPGGSASTTLFPGQANGFMLEVDIDGDGFGDTPVVPVSVTAITDAPPQVVGVHQWAKGSRPSRLPSFEQGDPFGRLVGVLFSEEVERVSVEALGGYSISRNTVVDASLQPDRRVAFVVLDKPIGPFVQRSLEMVDIADMRGNAMEAVAAPIEPDPDRGVAGIVRGRVITADGHPVPFALVDYVQPLRTQSVLECNVDDYIITTYEADIEGRFEIEFVLQSGYSSDEICNVDRWLSESHPGPTNHFKLEATDLGSGESGTASTRIHFDGQEMALTVVIRGFGTLQGFVFDEEGRRVSGGDPGTPDFLQVFAKNLSTGEGLLSWVDAEGFYAFPRSFTSTTGDTSEADSVPVGNVALQIARVIGPNQAQTGIVTANLPAAGSVVDQDIILIDALRFGSVRGVVREFDGSPAPNVLVQVAADVLTGLRLSGQARGRGVVASGYTDANGAFSFDDIPAGDVEVQAFRQATYEQAGAVSFLEEMGDAFLTLVFPGSGGAVRGIVIDDLRNPVAGATVTGGPTLTTADTNGAFEIVGLPLGDFTIFGQGMDSPSLGSVTVTTTGPSDVQEIVIRLGPTGSIVGTVFQADGVTRAVAQKVQLWVPPNKGVQGEAYTDANGDFRFDDYPVGAYSVRAVDPNTFDGGMALTEIRFGGDVRDADVVFGGLGSIEGRVVQSNGTPAKASVVVLRKVWKIVTDEFLRNQRDLGLAILDEFNEINGLSESIQQAIEENRLNADLAEFFMLIDEPVVVTSDAVTGRFQFGDRVAAGPFSVTASGSFLSPAMVRGVIPRTSVPSERVVSVGDIVLESATGVVTGRVFLPDGETPVGEGVSVKLQSRDSGGRVLIPGFGSVEEPVLPELNISTGPDGRFEFALALAGRFVITADTGVPDPAIRADDAAGMETERFDDLNVRLFGQVKGFAPPGSDPVDVVLRLRDVAEARVRVVQSDGVTPVEAATVRVRTGSNLDVEPVAGQTDEAGFIDFFPMIEGEFSVSVSLLGDPRRGGASGLVPPNPANGLVIPITVQLGKVTTASGEIVEAPIFGRVEGQVFQANGDPLENPSEVTIRSAGISVLTSTDATGFYFAEDVPGGFLQIDVFEPFTARRGDGSGTLVTDGATSVVDVTLVGLGVVSGAVFKANGSAVLDGIDVMLLPSGNFSDMLVGRSDASGVYDFPGVPLGEYTVMASDPNSGLAGETRDRLDFDGEVRTTDVFLESAGRIGGVVYSAGVLLDADGNPVDAQGHPFPEAPGAPSVSVRIARDDFEQTVQTDANGAFESGPFLGMGRYALIAESNLGDDGATATAELSFDGQLQHANLALRGRGIVEGFLLDSAGAGPIAGASITLASESPFSSGSITRITDTDGFFRFASDDTGAGPEPRVPLGAFSLSVVTNLQVPQLGTTAMGEISAHAQRIAFEDGDADLLHNTLRLQPVGSLTGQVLLADTVTPAEGAVLVLEGPGVRVPQIADATGRFVFEGVPLGSYSLSVVEPSSNGVAFRALQISSNGEAIAFENGDPDPTRNAIELDEDAPYVVSTQPSDAQAGADPTTLVEVTFSEVIEPASVSANSFELLVDGTPVAGSFQVAGPLLSFEPASAFPDLARVQVRLFADVIDFEGEVIEQGIRDAEGLSIGRDLGFEFTTADRSPPEILSLSPAAGAEEVAPTSVLRVEFSESVDLASIQSLKLVEELSGETLPGALNISPILGDRVIVFTPGVSLVANRRYTAILQGPVRDIAGNAMFEEGISWRFDTVDTLPPIVDALRLPPGAVLLQGAPVDVTADVSSEDDDISAVEFFVDRTLQAADTTFPYAFALQLPSVANELLVSAVAIDQAGNRSPPVELPVAISTNQPPAITLTAQGAGVVSQGATVEVRVAASDDLGLATVGFSASGAASAGGQQNFPSPLSAQPLFSFTVPDDAPIGAQIELRGVAIDTLGLVSQSAVVVLSVEDRLPPQVDIGSPAAGAILARGSDLAVLVVAEDAGGLAELRLAATGALSFAETRTLGASTMAAETFVLSIPAGGDPATSLLVTATAVDASGFESSDSVSLRLPDTEPPTLSLALSGDPQVEVGEMVSVTGTANDDMGVAQISLNVPGIGSQTRSFSPRLVTAQFFEFQVPPASSGQVFEVGATASDQDGNLGTATPLTLTVVDETGPAVAIVSPAAGEMLLPDTSLQVDVQASDAQGVVSVRCSVSGAFGAQVVHPIDPAQAQETTACEFGVPADTEAGVSIVLDATATDAAGNVGSAATVVATVADGVAPQVVSIVPAEGAVDVPTATAISVTFDEAVDAASFAAGFSLSGPAGVVAGVVSTSVGGSVFTFTPSEPLSNDASYSANVATGVTDLAGNPLAAPRSSTFRVSSDTEGPCILSVSPQPDELNLGLRPEITAVFDEPIAPASIVSGAATLTEVAGESVALTLAASADAAEVRFDLSDPLVLGTGYRIEWSTQPTDLAGNALRTAGECSGGAAEPAAEVALAYEFTTGIVEIVSPSEGQVVIETQQITLEATASAAIGLSRVDYADALASIGSAPAPEFALAYSVPTLVTLGGNTLTISADATTGDGDFIRVPSRTIEVLAVDGDADSDGLNNGDELAAGSNPFDPDTDGDGLPDGVDPLPTIASLQILSVDPPDGATGVGLGTAVVVRFSQPLDPATLAASSLQLTDLAGALPASLEVSAGGTRVTLIPEQSLSPGHSYTLRVTPALATSQGATLAAPFQSTFQTGDFAIVSPRDGERVAENSTLVLEARASLAVGATLSQVVFLVDGQELPTIESALPHSLSYRADFAVPASAEVSDLAIEAIGRDAEGALQASDTIAVSVSSRMRFTPRLVGIAPGEAMTLRLRVSAPPAIDLSISLSSVTPGVVELPLTTLTLPAGESEIDVAIGGGDEGATTLIASSEIGDAGAVVVVSPAIAGVERKVHGLAGAAVLEGLMARFALPTGRALAVRVPVLSLPASSETAVEATSSDPAVATVTNTPLIASGETESSVALAALSAGSTRIQLSAGTEVVSLQVVVHDGGVGIGAVPAQPVGTALLANVAGRYRVPTSGALTLEIPVLTSPATADTPVEVTNSDPLVATVVGAPFVPAGGTRAIIRITGVAAGSTHIQLRANGERITLEVIASDTGAGRGPVVAAPTGVALPAEGTLGVAYLDTQLSRSIRVSLRPPLGAGAVTVEVESPEPSVASVSPASFTLDAAETEAIVTLNSGAVEAETLIFFRFGDEVRSLRVVTGLPPAGAEPFIPASPVGVEVEPAIGPP